ncbi:MAG TPA: FTR1 family protein [Candidatus Binataceae bacterium]|nr:FTR1 family protein [Candidatus Binataceae bacterium]
MAQTPVPYFFYALGILLREGMEAMLVVVALAAGVKQMGQGRRVREIYCGALLAIAASVLMAWGLAELISDDANDTMEGIFQLVAAGTLFYVSSWLTAKTQANRWREFLFSNLKESGRRALPFAMGVTAFLAVLREGAETIVFFQALLAGASKGIEQHAIWAGVSAAAAVLLIAFFTLQRFLVRIPLGAFFRATSVLLYAMAIIFVGQGIASLQEASVVRATFVSYVPTIKALGIFPTVQTLAVQMVLIAFSAGAFLAPRWQEGIAGHARSLMQKMKKGQRVAPARATERLSKRDSQAASSAS